MQRKQNMRLCVTCFMLSKHSRFIAAVVLITAFGLVTTSCSTIQSKPEQINMQTTQSIFDIPINTIDGKPTTLAEFKGKKILIVNVASECGYTPQYSDLQKLYEKYKDKLVVAGFPANNFGGQEPGSNEQIASFCSKNFGVTFPMFEKISVKGSDKHALYQWLTDKSKNGWNDQEPTWNFCKYLIDENGQLIKYFPARVSPMDSEITSAL
jgi:glutathione peroxidase